MKIAIHLFATSPRSVTGAFVYIQNILPALFRAEQENIFYLLGELDSIEYFKSLYGNMPNVRFRSVSIAHDLLIHPIRAAKKLMAKVRRDYHTRERLIAEEINTLLKDEDITIYFSPATLYPRGLHGVHIVTTIHDLQYEYFPENFSPRYLAQRKDDCAYAVAHSNRLIAISNYTKKTLEEKCGAAPEKISVIYHAPQQMKKGSASLKTPEEFLFYPATLWPHKNHRILIKALGILKSRFLDLHLICTGSSKGGNVRDELLSLAESEGVRERVSFLGYVSDGDLSTLYTKAKALVFPSSFEGFGIPLLEAFQFGLPVIAADNSSITEVVDGAGVLVPTGDVKALAEAIERVLTNSQLRDELIAKGHERAKLFSWEKAARETLEVFHSVAD